MKKPLFFIMCFAATSIFALGFADSDWQQAENYLEQQQYDNALSSYEKVIEKLCQTTCVQDLFIDSAHKASILSAKLGDQDKSQVYADLIRSATLDWYGKPYRIRTRQSINGQIENTPRFKQISFQPWNSYWGVIYICNKCGTIYNSNPGTCERRDCDSTLFTATDVFPD